MMHRFSLLQINLVLALHLSLLASAVVAQARPGDELVASRCWSYPLSEAGAVAFAPDADRVFLGMGGARVEAVGVDGAKLWSTDLGGDITSNLLPSKTTIFVATAGPAAGEGRSGEGILRALSRETGITLWTLKLTNAVRHALHSFNEDLIIVSTVGAIQSVDAKSGSVKWKREIADGFVASPVFGKEKLLVAASGKQVFGVLLATGEIDSMRRLPVAITALTETSAGELVTGDERGNITAFVNGSDKISWRFKAGGQISGLYAQGDNLLVTSHDNFVYFMSSRNGDVVWKKRLAGRVSHVANIANKYALSTSFDEPGAAVTELLTGKPVGQIVLGSEESITADPSVSSGRIFILTTRSLHAVSFDGCSADKKIAEKIVKN
jgi:outer membrane protein assembly factor BamB